jgi:hypothetical protein
MVVKRILSGITFLLSLGGLLLSLAGGVGVWMVKEPVTAGATQVFARIEAKFDIAEQSLNHVATSLANAAERLDRVRQKQRELAQKPQPNRTLQRILARKVQQRIARIAPQLGNANEELHTVAEAAVVVNSILEDVGSFPFLSISGLENDRLTEMNRRLAGVAPAAWELSRLLGEPGPGGDSDAAGDRLSRIERTVKTLRRFIAQYESQLQQVRQRTEGLKAATLQWITPASVLISLVCLWIALSQVSLLCHACSWWKHAGRPNP